jgi:hypothetical protein
MGATWFIDACLIGLYFKNLSESGTLMLHKNSKFRPSVAEICFSKLGQVVAKLPDATHKILSPLACHRSLPGFRADSIVLAHAPFVEIIGIDAEFMQQR